MDKNNKSIQVLNRAFEILKIIKSEKSNKMSLGKIAKLANLLRSTVQRIVNSLIKEDFLSYSTDQGIQIGNEIYKLATTDNYDIVKSLKPVINSLSNKTRETVDLAILNNDHMLLLDRVLGTYRLGVNSKIGLKLPLSTTASGKSALSLKLKAKSISVVETIDFKKPKTKSFAEFISAIGLNTKKTLIVVDGLNKNVYLSARNLKKSEVVSDSEISTYKIMNAQHLVIEEKAIEKIESNLE